MRLPSVRTLSLWRSPLEICSMSFSVGMLNLDSKAPDLEVWLVENVISTRNGKERAIYRRRFLA